MKTKLLAFLHHWANNIIATIVPSTVALYFTIQKCSVDVSLPALLKNYLNPSGVEVLKLTAVAAIVYACIVAVTQNVLRFLPGKSPKPVEPIGMKGCLYILNKEIEKQIEEITNSGKIDLKQFPSKQSFDVNVALTIGNLADHIKHSIKDHKIKNRDLAISLYIVDRIKNYPDVGNKLVYLTHFPPERNVVLSKEISITDDKHKDYKCSDCILDSLDMTFCLDCKAEGYIKKGNKRHKTVKHYVGFNLKVNQECMGFLNIEFHKKVFTSREVMESYIGSDLQSFKYLLQYQILKKILFNQIKRHKNGKVTSPEQKSDQPRSVKKPRGLPKSRNAEKRSAEPNQT